jgi:predicted permease
MMLDTLWKKLLFLLRRGRFDRELDEEMQFHLAMKTRENLDAGMSPEEAHYSAMRRFGNQPLLRETSREVWFSSSVESLLQDLRYGLRMLRRSPGFTAAAVLSLALGIGANTAIFSLIDALLLEELPVKNPQQLVTISSVSAGGRDRMFSYTAYKDFRDQTESFAGALASSSVQKVNIVMSGPGEAQAELVERRLVSGNYFSVLGVDAIVGRTFTADEDRVPGEQPLAVISYGYWQRRFGGDPSVVGKTFTAQDTLFTIIGVAPPEFFGESVGESPDLWMPLTMAPRAPSWLWKGHSVTWLQIMGRLKPGVTVEQAQASAALVFERIQAQTVSGMENPRWRQQILEQRIELAPGSTGFSELRERFAQPLKILMAVVGVVLLIACANVSSMMLARSTARQREMAVRLALGASRMRLVRQFITESVLMSLIGGGLGLLFAYWGAGILIALVSRGPTSPPLDTDPNLRVFVFTLTVSLLAGITFGLVPALRATQGELAPALKEDARTVTAGRSKQRLGKALVGAQVALSLLLLIGAGLFVRSLQKLKSLDPGFNRENVLLLRIDARATGYKDVRLTNLYTQLLERVAAVQGVRSASLSFMGLFGGGSWGNKISVQGYTPTPNETLHTFANAVGPTYFETMGMSLRLGRAFTPHDNENAPKVAVVNESMARRYFGSENAIGRRFGLGGPENSGKIEIVGVVRDAKYTSLREAPRAMTYVPFLQYPAPLTGLEVRTAGIPSALAGSIRQAIQAVDKNLPVLEVTTLADQVDSSLIQERLFAKLSSAFSLLALALSCVGLYGLMAYSVTRRTGEIGLRMALGAERRDVLWLILREVLVLVLIGVAMGIPAALAGTQLISSFLFGLTPSDPGTIAVAALLMVAVAALAGYLPARRASRVDPMVALRHE